MARRPRPPQSGEPDKRTLIAELRVMRIAMAVLVGLVLAAGVILWQIHSDTARRDEMRAEAMRPSGSIGGPFTLTDQDGKTVRSSDFRDKYLLVYFGYTYCPDLCPTGLSGIAHALDLLGADAKKIQTLFITIDPARDTPAKLKQYVESFHPDIMGLTGSSRQIADVAAEYKVYYAKGETVEGNDYIMDHSSLIYLMGPGGNFLTSFPDDVDPNDLATAIRHFIDKKEAGNPAGKPK